MPESREPTFASLVYRSASLLTATPETDELQEDPALAAYRTFQTKYFNDPRGFVRDCFSWGAAKGKGPAFYQEEILDAVPRKKRVSARGPRGLGKTAVSAWLVLWFSLTRDGLDWKMPTTAGGYRQLSKYLWPEIHKWARRIRWDVVGRQPFNPRLELLTMSLKLRTGEAFAVASDTPDLIEGAHAEHLFFLFDESKSIKPEVFDSVEGAFSNAGGDTDSEAFAAAFSTPGEPNGRFYDIQSKKPGYEDWTVRAVTLQETIKAGIISSEWVARRKRQWGEKSPIFINHVEGNFASSDEDGVVPLLWVEAANERWMVWAEGVLDRLGIPYDGPVDVIQKFALVPSTEKGILKKIGADIAGGGADKTVLAMLYEYQDAEGTAMQAVDTLRYSTERDTMATVGEIVGILEGKAGRGATAVIDVIGLGTGPYHRLQELKVSVEGFNASGASVNRDRSDVFGFINKRSAGWWGLRELLNLDYDATLALPPDDTLIGDLTAPHYKQVSGGRIQVEGKPDIKTRIGRSTDAGDAVMMAVFEEQAIGNAWAQIARDAIERKRAAKQETEDAAGALAEVED